MHPQHFISSQASLASPQQPSSGLYQRQPRGNSAGNARDQSYKTYFFCSLLIFVISQGVCPWQAVPAQFNVYKRGQEIPSEQPFRCSTQGQAPDLTHKQQTKLERLARDIDSNFFRKFVNYRQKSLKTLTPVVNVLKLFLSVKVWQNKKVFVLFRLALHL